MRWQHMRHRAVHQIRVFTDRYPWLGPLIYVLSLEFFVVQAITASAWTVPFSLRLNTLSDLGATTCGIIDGRSVCSPLYPLMNAALVAMGCLMAGGSLLIYQEFRTNRGTLVGFTLMGLAGLGTIVVGLFPENINLQLHVLGAGGPFILGNLSLIILSLAISKISPIVRAYTFFSGLVALIALAFFVTRHFGDVGKGGIERIVAYPQNIWLVLFGIYMSRNRFEVYRKLRRALGVMPPFTRHRARSG